jgi:hypothetical protein
VSSERIELQSGDFEDARAELSHASRGWSQSLSTSSAAVGSHSVFVVLARIDDLVLTLCAALSEVAAELLARLSAIADEFRTLDRRLSGEG